MSLLVNEVLRKAIDLEDLYDRSPELFNLSGLDFQCKLTLIDARTMKFLPIFKNDFSPDERASIIFNVPKKTVRSVLTLTDEELLNLKDDTYTSLVKAYFNDYIRVDAFNKLGIKYKLEITRINPRWVFENIKKLPTLTSDLLTFLAQKEPSLIDEKINDFTNLATTRRFWELMIKYNEKYKLIFLQNTKSLITKTDVRGIIKLNPELLKDLNEDIIANSKLTVKEWLLLCNAVIESEKGRKVNKLEGWEFSDKMKEIFRLDSLADVLSGKAKLTTRFANAMNNVLEKDEEEIEGEQTEKV